MAFPFVFQENFELGTKGGFDTETDTGSQLDFPHVSELAQYPWPNFAPFRGAYCARWQLGANTTDAMLIEGDIDIADGATRFFRWYLYIAPDFRFTADDIVTLFRLEQAAGTDEVTVGLSLTAATDLMVIGAGDGSAAATFGTKPLVRGVWHAIEVSALISTGGSGTVTVWLDGVQQVALTSQTHAAAVGQGVLGVLDRLATTTGTLLMDQFVMDDARVYPIVDRYPQQVLLTQSGHVFVGPGIIDNVSLLSGGSADNVLSIFDTNRANTSDASKVGVELKNVTAADIVDPAGMPVQLKRGAYVALSGTNPRALVNVRWAPAYGSVGAVRTVASRLRVNPIEVL